MDKTVQACRAAAILKYHGICLLTRYVKIIPVRMSILSRKNRSKEGQISSKRLDLSQSSVVTENIDQLP